MPHIASYMICADLKMLVSLVDLEYTVNGYNTEICVSNKLPTVRALFVIAV